MNERTWQLAMFGRGLEHVSPQARADMARLLDLDPSISHLTIEVGDQRIHVARDWPSDRLDEADRLLQRVAGSGGLSAILVHGTDGKPAKRIASGFTRSADRPPLVQDK